MRARVVKHIYIYIYTHIYIYIYIYTPVYTQTNKILVYNLTTPTSDYRLPEQPLTPPSSGHAGDPAGWLPHAGSAQDHGLRDGPPGADLGGVDIWVVGVEPCWS